MALRGQARAPRALIDFEYRQRFHLSYKQLLEEPIDIYEEGVSIIFLEYKIKRQIERQRARRAKRAGRG